MSVSVHAVLAAVGHQVGPRAGTATSRAIRSATSDLRAYAAGRQTDVGAIAASSGAAARAIHDAGPRFEQANLRTQQAFRRISSQTHFSLVPEDHAAAGLSQLRAATEADAVRRGAEFVAGSALVAAGTGGAVAVGLAATRDH